MNSLICITDPKALLVADTSVIINLTLGCTGDLFAHDQVQKALGLENLSDAVYNALRYGRMRVMDHFLAWTVELTGPERATKCPSLPKSVRPTGTAFDVH